METRLKTSGCLPLWKRRLFYFVYFTPSLGHFEIHHNMDTNILPFSFSLLFSLCIVWLLYFLPSSLFPAVYHQFSVSVWVIFYLPSLPGVQRHRALLKDWPERACVSLDSLDSLLRYTRWSVWCHELQWDWWKEGREGGTSRIRKVVREWKNKGVRERRMGGRTFGTQVEIDGGRRSTGEVVGMGKE